MGKKPEDPPPVQVGKASQYDVDIDPKLEVISKMRLSPHGGVAGRLPAFGGIAGHPAFAENLYLINRSEVPPSGGALNPDSPF